MQNVRRMQIRRRSARGQRLSSRFRSHQRLVGACLAGIAAFVAISAARPAIAETTTVVVAANNIGGGHVITDGDLAEQQWPVDIAAALPLASRDELVGRSSTGPIAAAELITANRIVGPHLLDQLNLEDLPSGELVAAPVRLADPSQALLLQTGDLIDVVAARPTDSSGQQASAVAVDARVLSVPAPAKDTGTAGLVASSTPSSVGNSSANLVLVAVDQGTAIDLAAATTRSQLSVVLKRSRP